MLPRLDMIFAFFKHVARLAFDRNDQSIGVRKLALQAGQSCDRALSGRRIQVQDRPEAGSEIP